MDYKFRDVPLHVGNRTLGVAVANSLFSRGGVDAGTRLLLHSLASKSLILDSTGDARPALLDLGCGDGPIALGLAATHPTADVVALDRDWLAVRFTRHNAAANKLENLRAEISLDYEALRQSAMRFDAIVSNLPAKAGDEVLRHLVFGAGNLLKSGGLVAVVFIKPLEGLMHRLLSECREYVEAKLELETARQDHVVWHLRFAAGLPDALPKPLAARLNRRAELGTLTVYGRADVPDTFDGVAYAAVHNVAEFDTLDYRSELVLTLLQSTVRPPDNGGERILSFNPRHGLMSRWVMWERRPKDLALVDRDWLALRIADQNLRLAQSATPAGRERSLPPTSAVISTHLGMALAARDADPNHGGVTRGPFDLIVGVVREEEEREGLRLLLTEAVDLLAPTGSLVVGLGAGEIHSRLEPLAKTLGMRIGRALKRRGLAAQVLRPPR